VELSASRVVGNSRASLGARGRLPVGKYMVIPNGLDFRRFPVEHREGASEGPLCIVMTASFSAPKDHLSAVRAACRLLSEGYTLRILFLGDGPARAQIMGMIPREYSASFEFPGKMGDVENVLAEMDIGLLLNTPGHAEGMSNAIMEYMAAGLPVVCTNGGGNPELVSHGRNGYLVDYCDVEGTAQSLSRLIDRAELRKRMGMASRERALRRFSMSRMIHSYADLYLGLLE
jgi:glycosyltransferase involved in cell wall biosynthesis